MAFKSKEYIISIGDKNEDRLRFRFDTLNGRLVDMMTQYETKVKEKWLEVVRYDFAHGFFHRDLLSPKGAKEKKKIEINDIKLAAIYAEEDLKDRWEWYKEKYLKQIRKP